MVEKNPHASEPHKLLDGRRLAARIFDQLRPRVESLRQTGWLPRLLSVTIGDAAPVALYVRNQRRLAESNGLDFEERCLPADSSRAEVLALLDTANADPRVHGIILQRPVPAHLDIRELQARIHPLKDVEGMHPASIGNIVYSELELAPCTASASVALLRQTGLPLAGLEVVVIGHSEIVGKPIAFLLMAEGATVTVCHHQTRNLSMHSRRADAVFVAVGKPQLIHGDMLKPGAALIDIGINQISDANGATRTVGDADFDSCAAVAGWITPVPGGVGPVTVAMLIRNSVVAAERQRACYEAGMRGEAAWLREAAGTAA